MVRALSEPPENRDQQNKETQALCDELGIPRKLLETFNEENNPPYWLEKLAITLKDFEAGLKSLSFNKNGLSVLKEIISLIEEENPEINKKGSDRALRQRKNKAAKETFFPQSLSNPNAYTLFLLSFSRQRRSTLEYKRLSNAIVTGIQKEIKNHEVDPEVTPNNLYPLLPILIQNSTEFGNTIKEKFETFCIDCLKIILLRDGRFGYQYSEKQKKYLLPIFIVFCERYPNQVQDKKSQTNRAIVDFWGGPDKIPSEIEILLEKENYIKNNVVKFSERTQNATKAQEVITPKGDRFHKKNKPKSPKPSAVTSDFNEPEVNPEIPEAPVIDQSTEGSHDLTIDHIPDGYSLKGNILGAAETLLFEVEDGEIKISKAHKFNNSAILEFYFQNESDPEIESEKAKISISGSKNSGQTIINTISKNAPNTSEKVKTVIQDPIENQIPPNTENALSLSAYEEDIGLKLITDEMRDEYSITLTGEKLTFSFKNLLTQDNQNTQVPENLNELVIVNINQNPPTIISFLGTKNYEFKDSKIAEIIIEAAQNYMDTLNLKLIPKIENLEKPEIEFLAQSYTETLNTPDSESSKFEIIVENKNRIKISYEKDRKATLDINIPSIRSNDPILTENLKNLFDKLLEASAKKEERQKKLQLLSKEHAPKLKSIIKESQNGEPLAILSSENTLESKERERMEPDDQIIVLEPKINKLEAAKRGKNNEEETAQQRKHILCQFAVPQFRIHFFSQIAKALCEQELNLLDISKSKKKQVKSIIDTKVKKVNPESSIIGLYIRGGLTEEEKTKILDEAFMKIFLVFLEEKDILPKIRPMETVTASELNYLCDFDTSITQGKP